MLNTVEFSTFSLSSQIPDHLRRVCGHFFALSERNSFSSCATTLRFFGHCLLERKRIGERLSHISSLLSYFPCRECSWALLYSSPPPVKSSTSRAVATLHSMRRRASQKIGFENSKKVLIYLDDDWRSWLHDKQWESEFKNRNYSISVIAVSGCDVKEDLFEKTTSSLS